MEHESTVFFELRIKWSPALHYNYPSDFNDCLVFFCRPFDLLINWEMAVNYWMYRESPLSLACAEVARTIVGPGINTITVYTGCPCNHQLPIINSAKASLAKSHNKVIWPQQCTRYSEYQAITQPVICLQDYWENITVKLKLDFYMKSMQ